MPAITIAGFPQTEFFGLGPPSRLRALQLYQAQGNELNPEEDILLQLLGQRPDAELAPTMDSAQPAPHAREGAQSPSMLSRVLPSIFGAPEETLNPFDNLTAALEEANARAPKRRKRTVSLNGPPNRMIGY